MSTSEAQKQTLLLGDVLVDELDGTKFQVHELIGCGGMGEVYRAARLSDGAPCAVKCVRRDLVQNATILLRTRFEAKAFRKISHPNVVRVHGTGVRWDNVPWMSMEWLDGFTVGQILDMKGRIPLRQAITIVRDLCLGLHAIHEHAVHRDIKPSNVHLGIDGVTRALDLGAAKSKEANVHLTSTGFQVGTLPFMAPEQLDNTVPVDHRADLWAATTVLYIAVTGVHPFALGGSLPANKIKLGFSILSEPHRPLLSVLPSAPPFFSQIIDRGLAKDPELRHRSAEELAQVLTAALDFLEVSMGPAEPLSSLVAELRGETEPVAQPSRLICFPPRTTEPMPMAPGDARLRGEQDDAPQPQAAMPMSDAVTNKVPEMPEESEPDESRPAMLPAEVEVSRVSYVATKRPEPGRSPPASTPASEPAPPPAASNDVAAADHEDDVTPDEEDRDLYIELLAQVINELPDELGLPFIWNRIDKRSIDEIAEHTRIPAATVRERVLVAEATIKAEMARRLADGQDVAGAPVLAEEANDAKKVIAPELGPRGTVKMAESAATLLAKQGKTLEQMQAEARAARSEAYDQPTSRPDTSRRRNRWIMLAAALVVAIAGGIAALLLREPATVVGVSSLPAASTAPTASTTAAPTASTTAAPIATATVSPSLTAVPTVTVPRRAPRRLPAKSDPQAKPVPPRAPHRQFD